MKKLSLLSYEIILLLLGFFWVVLSFFYSFNNEASTWFARSGAIMVLFAVIAEYLLSNKLLKAIDDASTLAGLGIPAGPEISTEQKYVSLAAHAFVVCGTVIWGYGDLLM